MGAGRQAASQLLDGQMREQQRERWTERKGTPGRDTGPSRGGRDLVREGSEPSRDGQENLAACLTSSLSASLFIQTLVSRDTFMLFQT